MQFTSFSRPDPTPISRNPFSRGGSNIGSGSNVGSVNAVAMDLNPPSLMNPSLTHNTYDAPISNMSFPDVLGTIPPPIRAHSDLITGPVTWPDSPQLSQYSHNTPSALNLNTLPPPHPITNNPCDCFTTLSYALLSLDRLPASTLLALRTTRAAMRAAHATLRCPACTTPLPTFAAPRHSAASQTMTLLWELVQPLTNAYQAILALIDTEAAGMADPAAWQQMIRPEVRRDVDGACDGGRGSLRDLVVELSGNAGGEPQGRLLISGATEVFENFRIV